MLFNLLNNKYLKVIVFCLPIAMSVSVSGQDCCSKRCGCTDPEIEPAGIMYSHVHAKGSWMASYDYMQMNMQGNISGSAKISDADIYKSYLMSPDKMTMNMHMLMLMYGLTDRITVMGMMSYSNFVMNMNMYSSGGMQMPGMENVTMPNSQSVSGFNDVKLFAIYGLKRTSSFSLIASLGFSLPTGSINQKAYSGIYDNLNVDYNMQTGTGTVDFIPGFSFVKRECWFDWGAELFGTLRPFYNSNGYRFGNEGTTDLWVAKKWNSYLSSSIRLETFANGKISGYDQSLYSIMEPSANPSNYNGFKTCIYPGINLYSGELFSATLRLRMEYGIPVYQYAEGIQMSEKSNFQCRFDIIF